MQKVRLINESLLPGDMKLGKNDLSQIELICRELGEDPNREVSQEEYGWMLDIASQSVVPVQQNGVRTLHEVVGVLFSKGLDATQIVHVRDQVRDIMPTDRRYKPLEFEISALLETLVSKQLLPRFGATVEFAMPNSRYFTWGNSHSRSILSASGALTPEAVETYTDDSIEIHIDSSPAGYLTVSAKQLPSDIRNPRRIFSIEVREGYSNFVVNDYDQETGLVACIKQRSWSPLKKKIWVDRE